MGFIDKLLGNTSESRVKKLMPQVRRINELEPELHALSDEALRAKTMEFKERLGAGETLDGLCRRPLRLCARQRSAPSGKDISMCSFWAVLCCTRVALRK